MAGTGVGWCFVRAQGKKKFVYCMQLVGSVAVVLAVLIGVL